MGPKAYILVNVNIFTKKEIYNNPVQDKIIKDEGDPEISLKLNRENFYLDFDQYFCHHDYKQKKYGKAFDMYFNYFFEPLDFYLYYNKDSSFCLIQTRTKVAIDFLKELNKTGDFDLQTVKIDYSKMYPIINEISGAWIADLKGDYLKTAGLFGHHVDKSEEFKQAAKEGEVSSLRLRFINENSKEEHAVGISRKGAIVLYDNFNQIEDEINLVIEIYNKLINI